MAPPRTDIDAAGITTAPHTGGPFVTARMLVREQQVPVYLAGDPLRDVVSLYRWEPITGLARPVTDRRTETVSGWARPGRITVPGLDPVP